MKKTHKRAGALTVLGVGLSMFAVTAFSSTALAATVTDEASMLENAAGLESTLTALEAERGLEVVVETFPADADVEAPAQAKALVGDNENRIAVVLQDGTNELGVSYGKRVTYVMSQDTLTKIVDREVIPMFRDGDFDGGIEQLVESVNFFMALESEEDEEASSWFLGGNQPLAIAVVALLLFAAFAFFFIAKKKADDAEAMADNLKEESDRRSQSVNEFWSKVDPSVKDRYLDAPTKAEREIIMAEVVGQQDIVDDPERLSNLVSHFVYTGQHQPNLSIRFFLDQTVQSEEVRAKAEALWGSLDDDQRDAYRNAYSETHQQVMAKAFFPNEDGTKVAAMLHVSVPDSRSIDPEYASFVEEMMAKNAAADELKRKPRGFFARLFGK